MAFFQRDFCLAGPQNSFGFNDELEFCMAYVLTCEKDDLPPCNSVLVDVGCGKALGLQHLDDEHPCFPAADNS